MAVSTEKDMASTPDQSDDANPKKPSPWTKKKQASPPAKSAAEEDDAGKTYPPASSIAGVMLGLYLTLFLVALDRTIVATAVPKISDAFHAIDDIGWYGSAYLMTGCAFQLLFGRSSGCYRRARVHGSRGCFCRRQVLLGE